MSNKHDKEQRRKRKLRERDGAKQRTAIVRDGEKRTVVQQHGPKGYDVQMIRDFLDHLLLEVRTQHYENLKLLTALGATDDLSTARKVTEEVSQKIVAQFVPYQQRYQSALIACNVIDRTNASDAEARAVTLAVAKAGLARRDEQIGHLEALKDLFDEALACARLPFGEDQHGRLVSPHVVHKVRELADRAFLSQLPSYEELLPLFRDHLLATDRGTDWLKNHDRAVPILASNPAFEQHLILYGAETVRRRKELGQGTVSARILTISSYPELQFVIAAIQKFVGVPSTDGSAWKDL
jgi:hypothetical protein